MVLRPVPLVRYFSSVPKSENDSDEQEIHNYWGDKKKTGWAELEHEYRSVILAGAGAGKTYEMLDRARYSNERGRFAFFIRIEDIAEGFESAFEIGDAVSFEQWMESQDEAWFFLDSVDEARLENPRAFEKAIRRFATRIRDASRRAHIYISSRPFGGWRWRSDRDLLERLLPFERPNTEPTGDLDDVDAIAEELETESPKESQSALQVYMLKDLDEDDIRIYAGHRDAPKVNKLISDLQRANLTEMASRPFELESILAKWKSDQTLGGRLELLQYNIDLRLTEIDPDRAQRQPLNKDKARSGARALAAAVILTGEPGIWTPDTTHDRTGVDAEKILADWKPEDVHALLGRGIFNDALFGMVRFRHREVRELLAAEWLNEHLKNGNSRHSVEALLFREQYGREIITPRLRPALPWLILFDDQIRHKVIRLNPDIAVEGGDAARLPFAERQALLKDIVKRIANDEDDRSARDNSAIARIAQTDLSFDVQSLIDEYRDNDDAIFFLGRLVWQGEMANCVPALIEIATNPKRGIYARIASTRGVMSSGTYEQKNELWQALNQGSEPFPRKLLAEVVEDAEANEQTVFYFLESIKRLEARERYETSGLSQAIHRYIDQLPGENSSSSGETLSILAEGMNEILETEPFIERRKCHVSKEFAWLLGPATHTVERLVIEHSNAALKDYSLSILLKVPTARHWHSDDFDQYKDSLSEQVPAWPDLNDALFWRSVCEARAHIDSKKGERLIDDWPVQWIGHYWKFDLDSFGRVIDFITSRSLEDDKLVAVSLAHRIWVHSEKPLTKLEDLQAVVGGDDALKDRLSELLNAPTSVEARKWQIDDEKRKRKRERQERKQAENRAKWIEDLKADPDKVRHPKDLKPGEFTNHQYWLLGEIEGDGLRTSRRNGSNWRSLIKEFGEPVAHAYRDAAMAHWRTFKPGLRSEGTDTSSIPYSLIFGMAGLEIEAREVDGFPGHLTEKEFQHALHYMTWELNGFPTWLETAYRGRPEPVKDAILKEVFWELVNAEPDKPTHYILHDLVYFAPWIYAALVEPIFNWINANKVTNHDILRYSLQIMIGGDIESDKLTKLACSKVKKSQPHSHFPNWYAVWVDTDATSGIPALEAWLNAKDEQKASKSAQLFISALMGGRHGSRSGLRIGNYRNAAHLKALYVLMHRFVRSRDDIERAGKGVYSPELRDDAQDARNALFNQLSEIPGKNTYIALMELTRDHPEPVFRPRMAKLAYNRAENDGDLEPWSATQVREFEQMQMSTPSTNRQLFDLTTNKLSDLKNWLELGNESPYRTWQKAEDETEMRNLVAGWLNSQSDGRYKCAQENELPNKQRPDIWMQATNVPSPVPIELKLLDQQWSGPRLCERLRNQLAGDYLREATAGSGVMLLVWEGRNANKRWQIGKKRVGVSELRDALKEYWRTISGSFPNVNAIEIVVIDLTVRGPKSHD